MHRHKKTLITEEIRTQIQLDDNDYKDIKVTRQPIHARKKTGIETTEY